MRKRNGVRVGILGLIVAATITPGVAVAADFRVTTTADGDDKECVIDCTLREAVVLAGPPPDRVLLPAGNYVLANGELSLNNDTIVGENARTTFIDGGDKSRVLRVIEVTSRVSNVTIRNGNGVGLDSGRGGGIFVHSGSLILQNSTVSGNTGTTGAGIAASGIAALNGVTVSGNTASTGRLTRGGGILADASGGLILQNSTVSGNSAVDDVGAASQGGGVHSSGQLAIVASTIANNSAGEGGGLYAVAPQTGTFSLQNSLISHGTGGACGGSGADTLSATANVISDATCQFKDPSNLQSINPQIGLLANNGGPTNTHALAPASPAVGRAASCLALDQRGFNRVAPCDSGAYEYRAPTLTAVMKVVNDSGGTLAESAFKVHVRREGKEVDGSPQNGSEKGTRYILVPGTYDVEAEGIAGYALAESGDCAVTLQEGQNAVCTITANDIAPRLRVITEVINNDNGDLELGKVSVHVRRGKEEIPGSPKPGTATPGAEYELTAGVAHAVAPTPVTGYSASFGKPCSEKGTITLALAQVATCTLTLDDGASSLTVDTQVVNNDGGTAQAGDFEVSIRLAGVDMAAQPGSTTGTQFFLSGNNTYTVGAGGVPGYTFAVTGQCGADGSIALPLDAARACTITANDVAPKLTVVTQVFNDSGGTAGPGAFTVHVKRGGLDVSSSPQPGSSGTTYTLLAGAHAVSTDAVSGYGTAISGDCGGDGSITLNPGDNRTCTVTANDDPPPVRAQSAAQLPPPEAGKTVNALPRSGTVRVKLPGSSRFVDLDEAQQLPVGTVVDATKGHVTLVAAADDAGGTATAEFWAGIFRLGQTKGKAPTTTLTLVEKLSCPKAGNAIAAAKKKKRRLWGDGSGKFRTKGKHSAATVVGTKWLVEDKCTSTLTRVTRGRVSVRDFVKKKTVIVRAGKKYVARAKKP